MVRNLMPLFDPLLIMQPIKSNKSDILIDFILNHASSHLSVLYADNVPGLCPRNVILEVHLFLVSIGLEKLSLFLFSLFFSV